MPVVLVAGFGPFLEVVDNPAARLAREVDGRHGGGVRLVGRVMPVSYARGPSACLAWAAELGADAIVGIGVARGRELPLLERLGRRDADRALADVDGEALADLGGPEVVELAGVEALAEALGVGVSEDAGRYVCNAWIHRVGRAFAGPVAFLHVPDEGFDVERLVEGLGTWGGRG